MFESAVLEEPFLVMVGLLRQNGEVLLLPAGQPGVSPNVVVTVTYSGPSIRSCSA